MFHPVMGFEHLHRHSDFSILDGFATVAEYAEYQKSIDQKFLCITDHGTMGAVPQQIAESEKHGLFPLFGAELYINSMQPLSEDRQATRNCFKELNEENQKKFRKSHHLLAIACSDQGYANLVKLTSWAWIHGFYYKPRINHEVLKQYHEGIIFTSTCANSEIANAFFAGGDEAGFAMLETYLNMVDRNRFYLELMMLDFKLQKPYDAFLIRAHEKYGLPLILSQDCHYCRKEHSRNQRLMLMQQNKKTIADIQAMIDAGQAEDLFELQDENLWLKSEEELNLKWELDYREVIDYELYKQAKANTVKLAQLAKGVEIDRSLKLPKIPNADEILWKETLTGFKLRGCPITKEYRSRLQEEYDLICEKGYASYFLIQKMMTDEARRIGPEILGFGDGSEAVGPGRGSVGGSLVAYCLRLHDIEPIKHGLLFSRFLNPARGGRQMKIRHSIQPISHETVNF